MIFREMLDNLEGWESAWSAPLDNNIAGTQTHPHTMSLQETESVLFFNLGVEDKVIVQGSRFSKEGNCLWYFLYMQLRSGLDFTPLFAMFYLWCAMRVQNVTWDNFNSEDAEGSLGCGSCCLKGRRLQITTVASTHLSFVLAKIMPSEH